MTLIIYKWKSDPNYNWNYDYELKESVADFLLDTSELEYKFVLVNWKELTKEELEAITDSYGYLKVHP